MKMVLSKRRRCLVYFGGSAAAIFLILLCPPARPAYPTLLESASPPAYPILGEPASPTADSCPLELSAPAPNAVTASGNTGQQSIASPKERLNLLLITIDTLRADRVSAYSSFSPQPSGSVRTPNIDRLAGRGTVFARAFANTTTTLPSHANILLGVAPTYHGVHDNANFVVGGEFLTLAEHLQAAGYATGAFISGFPLDARFGLNQGFAVYDDRLERAAEELPVASREGRERRAEDVIGAALAWLEGRSLPWFLWVHIWDPHDPYLPPEPYKTRFAGRLYDGEVAYVDAALENLFKAVEEKSLTERTLVVLTGDHGESLGEHGERTHGFLAYNTTLWVPLIMAGPGVGRRVVLQNVSHVDIFPTACEVLGLPRPAFLQGDSLLPAIKGGKPADRPIYFESLSPYYNMDWAPIRGFVRGREKFVASPIPEIYDLEKDFGEAKNIITSGTAAADKKTLVELIGAQSSDRARTSARRSDRETIERLRSLGYAAAAGRGGEESFGPEDDVKTLLPFHNRAMDALGLYLEGRGGQSAEELKQVLSDQPAVATAYLNLAFICRSEGRPADAASVLKTGLEALPRNYEIFSQFIVYLHEAGNSAEATRVFEKARPARAEFDPVIWNYAGLAWSKMGDEKRARECFDRSLAIDPRFAVPWSNLGNLDYAAFRKTGDRTRLTEAAESYRKALALNPAYGAAYHGLGVVLFREGDLAGAVANLEKALALEPALQDALYFLGLIHYRQGESAKACDCFRRYKATPDFALLSADEQARINDILDQCK